MKQTRTIVSLECKVQKLLDQIVKLANLEALAEWVDHILHEIRS